MAVKISSDSLDREKRGRLLKDRHYEAAARARTATLLNGKGHSGGRTGAGGARSATAKSSASLAKPRSRESVLKVISWSKAASSAGKQARYIARAREDDRSEDIEPLVMENERGDQLVGRVAVDDEIKSWGLISDRDNLSAAARKATPEDRKKMEVSARFDRRQTVHMIFSIPARSTQDPEKLRAAVRSGLAETFGDAGHRYVFTIHTEHTDKPHAHIIVKATQERDLLNGKAPKALQLNPRELQALRYVLTSEAQARGIDVIATRREDRPELRREILGGQEPLRADKSWHQRKQTAQGRTFEKAAPNWYKEHGAAYERRRAELAAGASSMPQASPGRPSEEKQTEKAGPGLLGRLFKRTQKTAVPEAQTAKGDTKGYFGNFANVRAGQAAKAAEVTGGNPAMAKLGAQFARSHRDAEAARASFLALYREAPKLALWAAHNHPETFGTPTGQKPGRIPTTLLKELPKEARPSQEAWTAERDRAQKDEITSLKRATTQARSEKAAERSAEAIRRSIERAAEFAKKEIRHDPATAEAAANIQELAKSIGAGKPAEGDKAAQYAELEARIRRIDQAEGRRHQRTRGRNNDEGVER